METFEIPTNVQYLIWQTVPSLSKWSFISVTRKNNSAEIQFDVHTYVLIPRHGFNRYITVCICCTILYTSLQQFSACMTFIIKGWHCRCVYVLVHAHLSVYPSLLTLPWATEVFLPSPSTGIYNQFEELFGWEEPPRTTTVSSRAAVTK